MRVRYHVGMINLKGFRGVLVATFLIFVAVFAFVLISVMQRPVSGIMALDASKLVELRQLK